MHHGGLPGSGESAFGLASLGCSRCLGYSSLCDPVNPGRAVMAFLHRSLF